jgi:hypothetical protein
MSDTPRTDAQSPWIESPQLDFARQLERELAEAKFDLQFRRELYALQTKELAAVKQTMGELCESCGWSMRFPDQPCRCELERELCELDRQLTEAQAQRDRLAEALRELWNNHTLHGAAYELIEQTLSAVKGGSHD